MNVEDIQAVLGTLAGVLIGLSFLYVRHRRRRRDRRPNRNGRGL